MSHPARPPGVRHQVPGVRRAAPGLHRADHAGRARGLRDRAGRAQRRPRARAPAGEPPAHGGDLPGWPEASTACLPAGCGRNSPACDTTTGGRDGYGPDRTSPTRPAERPSRSCASTPSSRTRPPDTSRGPSAYTTGLKAGALADILVAPEEGQRVVGQRPDHGDAGRRAERKGGAGVGQQHDGFLGQPPGQRAVPGRVEVDDVSQCIGKAGIDRRNTGFYDDARQKAF